MRAGGTGKSRLRGATPDEGTHRRLVRAIQLDALAAVAAARAMRRPESANPDAGAARQTIVGVHVISSQPLSDVVPGVGMLPDAGGGLNAALRAAAARVRMAAPDAALLAMVADLPCLRAEDVLGVIEQAAGHRRSFVADVEGSGTTMLAVTTGVELLPQFGIGSAGRHAAGGSIALRAARTARCDVDTPADLQQCLALGVGTHTRSMLAELQPFT
ncbi:hypothetical protein BH10ACT8_BH10ACT8_15230 [soil metagenome]